MNEHEDDMTTHLLKKNTLVSDMRMGCGLRAEDATDGDCIGSPDGLAAIDCPGCLRGLIIEMRLDTIGSDTPEDKWLAGEDTGTSSLCIHSVMTGRAMPRDPDPPSDPSDFGRCHRLLEAFPAWRARMAEVAEVHREWAGLVGAWDELTELYLAELPSGRAPRLWKRMQALTESG